MKIRTLRVPAIYKNLRFDTKSPIHTETSLRMMSQIDPFVNVLRTTLSASACVIGGVDGIGISPFEIAFLDEDTAKGPLNLDIVWHEIFILYWQKRS